MKIYHNLLNNYQTSTANDRTNSYPALHMQKSTHKVKNY